MKEIISKSLMRVALAAFRSLKNEMKYLFLVLLFFLAIATPKILQATIIVVVITSKEVLISADSKLVGVGDIKQKNNITGKIQNVNGYYFAITGLHSTPDNIFSLPNVIKKLLDSSSNFPDIQKKLPSLVLNHARLYLKDLHTKNPKLFNEVSQKNKGGAIVIAGYSDKGPTMLLFEYNTAGSPDYIVESSFMMGYPSLIPPGQVMWRAYGNTEGIIMPSDLEFAKEPAKSSIVVIEQGIKLSGDMVGPPIRVLVLQGSGPKWIQ